MAFHPIKLTVSQKQQKQALRGSKIRIAPNCIGTGTLVMLHPLNYKKVVNAKGGINLELSPGEIMATAQHHGMMPKLNPEDMSGGSILDSIWAGLKSVGAWLKSSGVGSALADAAQTAATPFVGPVVANGARQLLKATTGVGIKGRKIKGAGLYL